MDGGEGWRPGEHISCGVSSLCFPDDGSGKPSTVARWIKSIGRQEWKEYTWFSHGCGDRKHNILDVRIDPRRQRVYLCGLYCQGDEMDDDNRND